MITNKKRKRKRKKKAILLFLLIELQRYAVDEYSSEIFHIYFFFISLPPLPLFLSGSGLVRRGIAHNIYSLGIT
jgi:hypothetical protein